MSNWRSIEASQSQSLTEARLQLHYAVQFIAITGAALAEPLPDDSHTAFQWQQTSELFVGSLIPTSQPLRVAIDPINLTLLVLHQQATIAALPLAGKTIAAGLEWLQQTVSQHGVDGSKLMMLPYPDDFPDHAIAHGAAFSIDQSLPLRELINYYANTNQLLQTVIATVEDASAINIWPHHFDMASLITRAGIHNGYPFSIGMGLSPGDSNYNEPYWYVTPYPSPETANLLELSGQGFWHTQGWIGAVLTGSRLEPNEIVQQQQVESFLSTALNLSISFLTSKLSTHA